jgi:hypothetical protein
MNRYPNAGSSAWMAIQRFNVVTESPKSFAICAKGASPLRAISITSWRNSAP